MARSDSKKSFCHYKSNEKINKENVRLLLNHDLVKVNAEKPKINATFACLH